MRSINFEELAHDAARPDPRARRDVRAPHPPSTPTAAVTSTTVATATPPAPPGSQLPARITGK